MTNNISNILKKMKKTQKWLAEIIEMDESYLSPIVKGKIKPGIEHAFKISIALNVKVDDVFVPEQKLVASLTARRELESGRKTGQRVRSSSQA